MYRGNPQQQTNESYTRFRNTWEPKLTTLTNGKSNDEHWHSTADVVYTDALVYGIDGVGSGADAVPNRDYTIVSDSAGGLGAIIYVPDPTGSGRILKIKNVSTGLVSVQSATVGVTIDGATFQTLYTNEGITIVDCAVDKWVIIDRRLFNTGTSSELTIAAGVITKTRPWHTVDTESDASSDYLDTINGGSTGDILILSGANDAREVIITRNGNVRFPPDHMIEGFSFRSPTGGSGTYYASGYYYAPAADANLTQASTTQTMGSANSGYGAHAFLVAAAAGTKDAGTVSIVVSGTSIANDGTRAAADSETIVADITAMATNSYYETAKRWIGQITYTLTGAGGATTYAADFNYGLASYDTMDERNHTVKLIEVMGRAGANDSGFDIQLLHHKSTGWTYSAAAFVPGSTVLCSWATDYNTEKNLVSGERFKYERELSQQVNGTTDEGTVIKIVTTANNAVEFMDVSIYSEAIPNDHHLKNTNQTIQLVYNGTNWMKV